VAPRPRTLTAALVVLIAAALLPAAVPAAAVIPRPATPAGAHVAAATASSFTVATKPAAHAARYVLFASLTKNDVIYSNLTKSRATRSETSSAHPILTIRGLKYTTATYYYRVEAKNGPRAVFTPIHAAHLAPAVPSNLQVVHPTTTHVGLALTWKVENALGFRVVQATDPKLQQHRRIYTLAGNATQFTPYGLTKGTAYYFQVRATNGTSPSRSAPVVSATFDGNELQVKVLAWNVLHMQFDGTKESGQTISPWSKRLRIVTSMIKTADPDIISIEEASDWYNEPRHIRQIDTLAANLKGTYTLVSADGADGKPNPRTGNYIFYRTNVYRALGSPGRWTISTSNWVTHQTLINVATGARFLFASVHLSHGTNAVDAKRGRETRALLADAHALVSGKGVDAGIPVVYAGDFNSYSGPDPANLDSPEKLLRAEHVADSLVAAQSRANTQYGSVNNYTRVPSHSGRIIDHVFGDAGVAMRTWRQIMNLQHGRWPGIVPSDHNPVMAGISIQY
jgi:endonuclease/exonuclease/phosphatase family metal-dependent hydrolase